jgi:hypothetical protein
VRTPAEELESLAGQLRRLAERMRDAEAGEAVFTKADVDRIVSDRLAREKRKTRQAKKERDELEREVEGLRRLTPGVDRGL